MGNSRERFLEIRNENFWTFWKKKFFPKRFNSFVDITLVKVSIDFSLRTWKPFAQRFRLCARTLRSDPKTKFSGQNSKKNQKIKKFKSSRFEKDFQNLQDF